MFSTPHNHNNTEVPPQGAGFGISDTSVLLMIILLIITAVSLPFWKVAAETRITDDQIVISIADKSYSTLLSSLFGKVGKDVPKNAHTYIKDTDEYRVRIAHGIKENNELTNVLYALIKDFPKKLESGYREEIDEIRVEAEKLKIAIFPYIENDATLSDAVVERYNLFPSLTEWLIYRINKKSVINEMNDIQRQSYNLRKKIALLYIRIDSVTQKSR